MGNTPTNSIVSPDTRTQMQSVLILTSRELANWFNLSDERILIPLDYHTASLLSWKREREGRPFQEVIFTPEAVREMLFWPADTAVALVNAATQSIIKTEPVNSFTVQPIVPISSVEVASTASYRENNHR